MPCTLVSSHLLFSQPLHCSTISADALTGPLSCPCFTLSHMLITLIILQHKYLLELPSYIFIIYHPYPPSQLGFFPPDFHETFQFHINQYQMVLWHCLLPRNCLRIPEIFSVLFMYQQLINCSSQSTWCVCNKLVLILPEVCSIHNKVHCISKILPSPISVLTALNVVNNNKPWSLTRFGTKYLNQKWSSLQDGGSYIAYIPWYITHIVNVKIFIRCHCVLCI